MHSGKCRECAVVTPRHAPSKRRYVRPVATSAAGSECDYDISGMSIEVLTSAVVTRLGESHTSKVRRIYRPSERATLSERDVMFNELHKEFNQPLKIGESSGMKSMASLGSERIEPEHFGIISVSAVRHALDRVRMIEWFLCDDVGIDIQFRDRPSSARQKVHRAKATLGRIRWSRACQCQNGVLYELRAPIGAYHRQLDRQLGGAELFVSTPDCLSDWLDGYPRFNETLAWTTPSPRPVIPAI